MRPYVFTWKRIPMHAYTHARTLALTRARTYACFASRVCIFLCVGGHTGICGTSSSHGTSMSLSRSAPDKWGSVFCIRCICEHLHPHTHVRVYECVCVCALSLSYTHTRRRRQTDRQDTTRHRVRQTETCTYRNRSTRPHLRFRV